MTPATWLDSLAATGHLHRLGWVVLHSLWQAAAVAAVLAVALRILPRRTAFGQEARYLLATLALFSLPVACGVTWTLVEPARLPLRAAADRGQQPAATLVIPAAVADSLDRGPIARASTASPAVPAAEPTAPLSASDAIRILAARAAAVAEPWLPTCAAVWLTGALAAALRLVVGWSLTRRLVATAAPLPDASWQTRLTRWTTALGIAAPIRILASSRVDVPIVVGWLRPVVIWPVAAVTGMPPEQIDAILAHELAHVRRHDVLVNLMQSVIEAVFFHHPAAWWISAQVRAEREHCADELAIRALAAGKAGSRISYATALLSLEERRQAILVAAANGGSLGDRIRRLVGIEQQSGHPTRLAAAVVVLAAVVATLATPPGGPSRQAMAAEGRREAADQAVDAAARRAPALPSADIARLIAEHRGVERKAESGEGMVLDLAGLTSLDPETARQLARYPGKELRLDGLEVLSFEAARELAGFVGEARTSGAVYDRGGNPAILTLNGLTSLSDEAAGKLGGFRGRTLRLNGLTAISPRAVENLLRRNEFALELEGLTTLDATLARILARPPAAVEFADDARLQGGKTWPLSKWNGKLPGLAALSTDAAQELRFYKGSLVLNGLTSLDAATAGMLAKSAAPALDLDGLRSIDVETAAALATTKPSVLRLNGLRTLPAAAARALAGFKGHSLHLNGLERIDLDTARGLATLTNKSMPWQSSTNNLYLTGLVALDAETARALVKLRGRTLQLDGLTDIDPDTARALAAFSGEHLSLRGLKTLDSDAAGAVATFKGRHLDLAGLATFTPAAAAALANYKGRVLNLAGLETLDAGTATALVPFQGELFLNGLTALDARAARALAASKASFLHLEGLTTLAPDAAEALAGFPRGACFRSLKHLTAAAAELQVRAPQNKGLFNFGLESSVSALDPEAARIMVGYASQNLGSIPSAATLRYNGLTTLSPDVARELSKFSGGGLKLDGVTAIDADTARALAGFHKDGCEAPDRKECAGANSSCPHCTASLSLNGLTTLSEEAARELATFEGQQLGLSGLPALSAGAAAALARFQGETLLLRNARNMPAAALDAIRAFEGSMLVMPLEAAATEEREKILRLGSPTSLDLDTATTLVASAGWDGQLPGITALDSPDSVAIAKALAERKGRLNLPNLEKISPQTLTALLKKEDVEIPLIETLELIPEPDGSPTEDFVIPDGFRQRQQQ
jgi:beta-lactamase regulating signal transducer with metallopeptidase domain